MPRYTPIATNKTAALSRVLDAVPRGYVAYISGNVLSEKVLGLAHKLDTRYGIANTPGQRIRRKRSGQSNALLVLYQGSDAGTAEWLLLATEGDGPVHRLEKLRSVTERPRLHWLGYELVRYAARGLTHWTWRRPATAMQEWYAILETHLRLRRTSAVADVLVSIARQPGFHGVREQSKALFAFARSHGYQGALPELFYVQKLSHGERIIL